MAASNFNRIGKISLVSLISPYRASRKKARETIRRFIEVYVRCPLEVCEKRDTKNMYRLARLGEIKNFTGISDPYEEPLNSEIVGATHIMDVRSCVNKILVYFKVILNDSCSVDSRFAERVKRIIY